MASVMVSATGQLHGGAIEQSVRYIRNMADALGPDPSPSAIASYVQATLARGQIVPGYGHALLRSADPRLEPLMQFVRNSSLLKDSDDAHKARGKALMTLILRAREVVPEVLQKAVPKMKNPQPNVDSLSGSVIHAFGIDADFVLLIPFCSRAMGCMAQYVWDKGQLAPRADAFHVV